MKRLDKIEYKGKTGVIIYENPNGNFDVSLNQPQLIYENVPKTELTLIL